jgi:RND family efflux transporter MFP subunit
MEGDPVGLANEGSEDSDEFPGQPIVQLRTGTLDIEIEAAKIQLALTRQAADELAASLPKEIELTQAKAAEAKARLQYSKNNYERASRLNEQSEAISQGELEQARSQYLADEELARGSTIEYERLVATKELRLLQAKLRVDASQQELTRLNDLKAKYTIRAPFAGLVTQKMTEVGEWVTQGQPIVEIVQLDPIEMIINTPQDYLNRVQQSLARATPENPLSAVIHFDGFEQSFVGVVKRVIAQADLRSRTFPVRLEIENPDSESGHALQPGMLGKASLMIGLEQDMLMVKKDALVLGGRQPAVYKIITQGDDVTAVPIVVETGMSIGDWIQITGNITPADSVVLLGNERLRPGEKLQITRTSDEVPPQSAP